jgi:hypothetical protein
MLLNLKHLLPGLIILLPSFAFADDCGGGRLYDGGCANLGPILPFTPPVVSTVPSNGDVNPYGVAFVPRGIPNDGVLRPGDILVSNFNNNQNLQGEGTTIIRIDAHGSVTTFFTAAATFSTQGLTGALRILSNGFVIVGALPTKDGTQNTVQPGSLMVINRQGQLVTTLTNPVLIDGPWGMAINDRGDGDDRDDSHAQIFVSNVLNGTIVRFDVKYDATTFNVVKKVTIGTGFSHRTDPAAIVLGPSGLSYDREHDTLFVASSTDNAIYALSDAGSRSAPGTPKVIYSDVTHLHGPLDLVRLPNGDFLVANSDGSNADPNQPSELVEFKGNGTFVAQFSVDPNNGGAFGVDILPFNDDGAFLAAAVDDNANTLTTWTVRSR